jgi:hypothetical protein
MSAGDGVRGLPRLREAREEPFPSPTLAHLARAILPTIPRGHVEDPQVTHHPTL